MFLCIDSPKYFRVALLPIEHWIQLQVVHTIGIVKKRILRDVDSLL